MIVYYGWFNIGYLKFEKIVNKNNLYVKRFKKRLKVIGWKVLFELFFLFSIFKFWVSLFVGVFVLFIGYVKYLFLERYIYIDIFITFIKRRDLKVVLGRYFIVER